MAVAAAVTSAAAMLIVVTLAFTRRAGVVLDQRLPVGNRDLVVIGMDFRERQEPVAVAAVLDKRRLERRLDPRYLG